VACTKATEELLKAIPATFAHITFPHEHPYSVDYKLQEYAQ